MRYLIPGAIVCAFLSIASAVRAQTTDPQLMAPINKFVDAFNKGDSAGAAATHASQADLVIIDEVPPVRVARCAGIQDVGSRPGT